MNLSYIISRLSSALLVIFGVVCMVFMLIHMVPGDPVEVMLGESAQPADRMALRASSRVAGTLSAKISTIGL